MWEGHLTTSKGLEPIGWEPLVYRETFLNLRKIGSLGEWSWERKKEKQVENGGEVGLQYSCVLLWNSGTGFVLHRNWETLGAVWSLNHPQRISHWWVQVWCEQKGHGLWQLGSSDGRSLPEETEDGEGRRAAGCLPSSHGAEEIPRKCSSALTSWAIMCYFTKWGKVSLMVRTNADCFRYSYLKALLEEGVWSFISCSSRQCCFHFSLPVELAVSPSSSESSVCEITLCGFKGNLWLFRSPGCRLWGKAFIHEWFSYRHHC